MKQHYWSYTTHHLITSLSNMYLNNKVLNMNSNTKYVYSPAGIPATKPSRAPLYDECITKGGYKLP